MDDIGVLYLPNNIRNASRLHKNSHSFYNRVLKCDIYIWIHHCCLMMQVGGRVLSIQSHVVSGYVGNKAAVFPLQLLGFDVDPIHTVQFSNHTGYLGGFRGKRLLGEEFDQLIEGLESNCLLQQVDYILLGYIGDHELLLHVFEAITRLKSKKPNLLVVCDPVMGDQGKLYVPRDIVPIYRDQVATFANILTPNQFELSILSNSSVDSLEEAFQACEYLHEQRKVEHIVVTSGEYKELDSFVILISSEFGRHKHVQTVEKIAGDIVAACEKAMASVHSVLRNTAAHHHQVNAQCPMLELQLISYQCFLQNPPKDLIATQVYKGFSCQ
ncbi:V-type proton ATPase catalytic subunit A [Galdieria sulphuraria]|nr:V-type proton ATPase catalytic subunit A [Galdieria sulphuraria]